MQNISAFFWWGASLMSGGLGGLDPFVVLPFCLDLLCGASDYNVLGFDFLDLHLIDFSR